MPACVRHEALPPEAEEMNRLNIVFPETRPEPAHPHGWTPFFIVATMVFSVFLFTHTEAMSQLGSGIMSLLGS
jgi:amino acid transporter